MHLSSIAANIYSTLPKHASVMSCFLAAAGLPNMVAGALEIHPRSLKPSTTVGIWDGAPMLHKHGGLFWDRRLGFGFDRSSAAVSCTSVLLAVGGT